MFDYAVVGSGIGGSSIAALLNSKGYAVALFEKEAYLGGSSSTFTHKGYRYNTGATTLAGYQDGYVVKEIFDAIGFTPDVKTIDPAMVVIQDAKTTERYRDINIFLKEINNNYFHEKNDSFWRLVAEINSHFYSHKNYYYSNKNIFSKFISLSSFFPMFVKFYKYLHVDAHSFIQRYFEYIDKEYLEFLEAQVYIVAQAPLKEISFFTAALALAYTFNENRYVTGGFSHLFDELTGDIKHLYRSNEIINIKKYDTYFSLFTKDKEYQAKRVILNSTIYDSDKLFDEKVIQNYYKKYEKLNNFQSSFMLYLTIQSDKVFHHHYQIIKKKPFVHTVSKALFVSFSDKKDTIMSKEGCYSVSASIHTDIRFWEEKSSYKMQKQELEEILVRTILETLEIDKTQIVHQISATPKTFGRFLNREQLGGNAMTMQNILPLLPANDTPLNGLYNVGDSVYAAQGWPGVMMGVRNLKRLLHV